MNLDPMSYYTKPTDKQPVHHQKSPHLAKVFKQL